jgi:hypothetical protein
MHNILLLIHVKLNTAHILGSPNTIQNSGERSKHTVTITNNVDQTRQHTHGYLAATHSRTYELYIIKITILII